MVVFYVARSIFNCLIEKFEKKLHYVGRIYSFISVLSIVGLRTGVKVSGGTAD